MILPDEPPTELHIVYWKQGAVTLGAFPSLYSAEAFINSLIYKRPDYGPKNEFEINELAYRPYADDVIRMFKEKHLIWHIRHNLCDRCHSANKSIPCICGPEPCIKCGYVGNDVDLREGALGCDKCSPKQEEEDNEI